jgi:hypothetical protein
MRPNGGSVEVRQGRHDRRKPEPSRGVRNAAGSAKDLLVDTHWRIIHV